MKHRLKKNPMTRAKRTRIVGKDGPEPVDVYVGGQIRKIRLLRDLTQTQLAERVGVKFQQMQKYESGASRVSASRLVMIAEALDTTIPVLFGKYGEIQTHDIPFDDRRVLKMVRAYNRLPVEIQKQTYDLIEWMGKRQ